MADRVDRVIQRLEDMDDGRTHPSKGWLRLIRQEDGDIIVAIVGSHVLADVEFCIPGTGGGKSPHTHRALLALFKAMEADEAGLPFYEAIINTVPEPRPPGPCELTQDDKDEAREAFDNVYDGDNLNAAIHAAVEAVLAWRDAQATVASATPAENLFADAGMRTGHGVLPPGDEGRYHFSPDAGERLALKAAALAIEPQAQFIGEVRNHGLDIGLTIRDEFLIKPTLNTSGSAEGPEEGLMEWRFVHVWSFDTGTDAGDAAARELRASFTCEGVFLEHLAEQFLPKLLAEWKAERARRA